MARRRHSGITVAVGIPVASSSFDEYGPREPVAPRRFFGSQSTPNLSFPGLVGPGENSNGFTAQTPNGTQHAEGNGANRDDWMNRANGRKWSPPVDWNAPGRRNRTGE